MIGGEVMPRKHRSKPRRKSRPLLAVAIVVGAYAAVQGLFLVLPHPNGIIQPRYDWVAPVAPSVQFATLVVLIIALVIALGGLLGRLLVRAQVRHGDRCKK